MADQLADALARLTWLAERVDGSPRESCAEADAIADAFPTAPLVRVRRGLIAVAAHRAAGDHNAAGGEADAAVELAQKVRDTEGEGLVRLSRAAVRLRLGDVTGCSADLDTAETLLHGDHLVDVQVQRASVALQLGRLAEAEDGLRRTISLGNEHHRPREVARAQSNLGLLFVQEGRYGEAEEQLTAAARGFQSLGLPDGRLYAEHNLGYLRFCQGQLPEALGHFEQAEVAAASTGVFLPGLEIDRAEALAEAGLLSAAERTAGAAAERLSGMSHAGDGLPMEHSDALVIQSLALAAQGDVESAERVAAEALRVAQLVDRPRWHAVAKLALLTVQASDGWDSERSEDLAEIVRALDDAQAVHYLGHALVLAIIAEPGAQAAAKRIDRLRMIARRGDDRLRCRMHLAQALVHEHHGRRRSAQRSARAALAAASRAAGESGGLELRFSTTGLAREAARVGLRCSARRDARMWWNDRHESWSSVFPALRPEGDQELRNLGAAVRNAEAALRQHMQSETDPVEIASASAAVMTAERRMNAYARSRRATTPPEMHTRERPPAGYDIVSIGEYDGELVGFCRIDGRFIEHHLGLAAEARNLIHRVGLRAQRAIEAGRSAISGRELSDLDDLFKPLVKDAHPSRPLALVPGRSLAGLCPGLVPSLRDLVVVRAGSTSGPFIATSLGSAAKISCIAGPSLEHAETEVRAIAALHRGDVAAPPDSSASRLLDALGNSDAVHLAMHLRHRDNPMFTELVCIDGAVRLHELQAVGAMPRLVILAVCEGGRALAAGGAAPADALLALGVECVVSSVLDVDDGASAGLMPALHASLRRGASVAAALRDLRCADEPSALAAACFDTRGADLHLA